MNDKERVRELCKALETLIELIPGGQNLSLVCAIEDCKRLLKKMPGNTEMDRRPLSPEILADALQDRVHRDLPSGRAARSVLDETK